MDSVGPALSESEVELLDQVTALAWSEQERRLRAKEPLLQADTAADFLALGLTVDQLDAARAARASARVGHYHGPWGRGWTLEVTIGRGDEEWRMVRQRGPERARERGWYQVLEVA